MKKSKKFLSVLLAISMILAMAVSASAAEAVIYGDDLFETDSTHDSYSTAMKIEDGNTYHCILTSNDEEDWYKVNFNQGGKGNFWIYCSHPADSNLCLQLYVLTSENKLQGIGTSHTGDRENQQAFVTDLEISADTTYYIKVSGDIGSMSANYLLRARRVSN